MPAGPADMAALHGAQIFGMLVSLAGAASLNRSFGLVMGILLRIFAEEKFLRRDGRYREYAKTARWRLCPFVF